MDVGESKCEVNPVLIDRKHVEGGRSEPLLTAVNLF